MFVAILNWMLANTPAFLRPGVNWLVSGLRKITGYIASLWNSVGNTFGTWYNTVAATRVHLTTFASTVVFGLLWLRYVWVPAKVGEAVSVVSALISAAVTTVRAEVLATLLGLYVWARLEIGRLASLASAIIDWAQQQIARIDAFGDALLRALAHVTNGPEVLSYWLIGALWKVAARYAYAQRDRIADWLLRGSQTFAIWIARVVEDTLVRML